MALAGDHAQSQRESWREIATQVYVYCITAIAVMLLFLLPPHLDLRLATVLPVILVGAFLAAMERPVKTSTTNVAPLTAIISASGVVFGAWTIVLAVLSGIAIRLRIVLREGGDWRGLLSPLTLGQISTSVIAAYAILGTWNGLERLFRFLPQSIHSLTMFIAIICVGLTWQTVNNFFVNIYQLINGRPFLLTQLVRIGIVASVYGYLLVATYQFGGLLATAIFYTVVVQIKVVQDILGITTQLHKLEKAQDQAQGLVRDLVRFTDTEDVEFSGEVQNISQMIGRRLGMAKTDIDLLAMAAQLHEIGKSRLSARIRIGSALNARETAQKGTYARWGGLMVRAADALLPNRIADWIEFHTEHYDGSGYPRGLKGESIPLASRIIGVARDYVRFLTGYDGAERVEKEKALALLREGSGTLYDPKIVSLLSELVS